ncbi:outer membrane protein assembly factor BamB [Alteromonas confluentis]|uniref:Outer membrane protein assembly factor BamB n=1 Tax=Alteromonas confluentis TaxID=1656094 RepID=A0A1E7ZAV4_9ALTE|nr:outer membrane protein assembly factor BamB [Alteromonas confluentis]
MTRATGLALLLSVSLSGCTTISDWFADEEELEIRRLAPLDAEFKPTVNWETEVGDGVDGYFSHLRPVYANDKLYIADRHGVVAALDPQSGDKIWEKDFAVFKDEGWKSSITNLWSSGASAKIAGLSVSGESVFVGTEDGILMSLNAQSGELNWSKSVEGEILAAPASGEGLVVVNTGAGTLFAFDSETGESAWQNESDVPPLTLRGISTPAISNGGVIVGTPTGKIQVNIIDSGIVAWETPITAPSGATELERIVDVDAAPLLYGGIIYAISYNGTLAAIELRSGRVIWKREYGSYRNVSLEENALYVVDNNSHVYALDRRNGVEMWSQSGLKQRVLTAAEPIGNYIVVGDKWGYVHWINKESGKIAARYDLGGDDDDESVFAAPLRVGNAIIAVTREGDVASLTTPE